MLITFLNNLTQTSKNGRNVGFKDILTSETPGNISNFKFYKDER